MGWLTSRLLASVLAWLLNEVPTRRAFSWCG
jgi:hypothetical protein